MKEEERGVGGHLDSKDCKRPREGPSVLDLDF
jgi:hypothetical protein